jgi:hypothetical protein
VRDEITAFVQVSHPENVKLMANLTWIGGRQTDSSPDIEVYLYNSSDWTVNLQLPQDSIPTYYVTLNYQSWLIYWEGTYQNGIIAEIAYFADSSLNLTSLPFEEQVRDEAMNYIRTQHPSTATYMTSLDWISQVDDTTSTDEQKYAYVSGGWMVTVQYPVNVNPTYTIYVEYSGDAYILWQGVLVGDVITEMGYNELFPTPTQTVLPTPSYSPTAAPSPTPSANVTPPRTTAPPTPVPQSLPIQISTAAWNYIRVFHNETRQYAPTGPWFGGSVGGSTYVLISGRWNMTLTYSGSFSLWEISAKYTGLSQHPTITWAGTWQDGIILEKPGTYAFIP